MSEPLSFGGELRRLREERGLSQSRLARLTFLDTSHISRLESGSREPSLESVGLLSAALGLGRAEEFRLHFVAGYVPVWVIGMSLDDLVGVLERLA